MNSPLNLGLTSATALSAHICTPGCKLYVRRLSTPTAVQGIPVSDGHYRIVGYRFDGEKRMDCDITIQDWLDPFWKQMETVGVKVASRIRNGGGEYIWSLAPLESVPQPKGPSPEELLPFVEEARILAGHRAHRGLEIALSGKVQFLSNGTAPDQWQVQGSRGDTYTVSIQGKSCTCPDAANGAPRHEDAPLCKHRLACIFIQRWQAQQKPPQLDPEVQYITVTATRPDEWHWQHYQPHGFTRTSRDAFPCRTEAVATAQVIARTRNLPLYLSR